MVETPPPSGLGQESGTWPELSVAENTLPIDALKPGSELHGRVLSYLTERLNSSEKAMGAFYSRWQWNEQRVQAYINLPDYEKALKAMNKTGEPPKVTSIVMPYAFATQATIVTYLLQAFTGRKPMFNVGTYNDAYTERARNMEILLQYNADHTRLVKHLFQFFSDGELYGLSVMRTMWRKETKKRSKIVQAPKAGWLGIFGGNAPQRVREDTTVFEGTMASSQDPFMFFPDPKVPMCEVSRRGEFVFWRTFEGKHTLKKEESAGRIKWVDNIPTGTSSNGTYGLSSRDLLSEGDAHPGMIGGKVEGATYYQIDQGTIDIIPAELGLGSSKGIERWIFSIANKGQIIQAEPLDLDHGMHPVVVAEPYTMGYGFGQPGLSDYLGPIQDTVSWFLNSHIHNVRTAINNMFVVDPSMIEMQDLKNPGPGKFIRLKRAAYGRDVRQALTQLPVTDITRGHVNDMDMFLKIGDALAAVNDNLRGLQDSGGRKSATEARTSAEAAASRLASHAKLISSQAIIDLAEQMCLNYQQFLSTDFEISVLGDKALKDPLSITPESISGDFVFPVNDGMLPIDKVAMLDVWKEVMVAVMQDQQLRASYDVPKLFEFVADLGGAKNLDSMRLAGDAEIAQGVQAGNLVPAKELGLGQTPGVSPNPGDRIAGALG